MYFTSIKSPISSHFLNVCFTSFPMADSWPRDAEIEALIDSSALKDAPSAKKHVIGTKVLENPFRDPRAVAALSDPVLKDHPSVNFLGTDCFGFETQDVDDSAPEYANIKKLFRSDLPLTPVGKLPNQHVPVSGVSALFSHDRGVYKSMKLDMSPRPSPPKSFFLKLDLVDLELNAGPVEPICCQVFVLDEKRVSTERWNFYPPCSQQFFSNKENVTKATMEITGCSPASHLACVYYRVLQTEQGTVCNDYYRKPGPSTVQKAKASVQASWPKLKDVWSPFAYSIIPMEDTKGSFEFPPAIVTDKRITGEMIGAQIEKGKSKSDTLPFTLKMVGEFAAVTDVKGLGDDRVMLRSTLPYQPRVLTDFRHELVLTLASAKIDAPGKLNARNIVPEVMFVNGKGDPVKCIRPRWGNDGLSANAFGCANYHDKTPQFDDEFIIELPSDVSPDAYIVVRYHHASTQDKEAGLREVGLSVIKVCAGPGLIVEDGTKQTGIHYNLQLFNPSPPNEKNVLVYETRLRSILMTTQPVGVDLLSTKKQVMPRIDELPESLTVNRLFVVLDQLLQFVMQTPADAVKNLIKIGKLTPTVSTQYLSDALDIYVSYYALRDVQLQKKEFHRALLSGLEKVLPQCMEQSVNVVNFLFRLLIKSFVITKDRSFGKEFDGFFRVWIENASKLATDKMQRVNEALGTFVKSLCDIGFYELCLTIVVQYCQGINTDRLSSIIQFMDCAVNGKLFITLTLAEPKFDQFMFSLIENAFKSPDSKSAQTIFRIFAKLLTYVPKELLSAVAAKYANVIGLYHDQMSLDPRNIQASLAVLAFVMRHCPKKEFHEAYEKIDAEKFFKLLHFLLNKTKLVSEENGQVTIKPPTEGMSILTEKAPSGVATKKSMDLSEQVTPRSSAKNRVMRFFGSRGSMKMPETKQEVSEQVISKPRNVSVKLEKFDKTTAFSLGREIALDAQFAVLHALILVMECTEANANEIHEVLYHLLSMNIGIDCVTTLREVLYLFTEKHPRVLIESAAPPFTIFAKKLLSLASVHNEAVADSILAVFPRIFAAERRLYPSNNRTLVCGIRAISLLTDTELESPVLIQAMKKRADGGNMDKMIECIEKLTQLNNEMRVIDPGHFSQMRKTGTCGGATNTDIVIERYADCIYERAMALVLSPDALVEQLLCLASYNQKNGHLSEAFMDHIYICGVLVEYLAILGRMQVEVNAKHPGDAWTGLCPKLSEALCPEFIMQDMPNVPTYCDSSNVTEAAAFVALQDAFAMAQESNLFEYASEALRISSYFLENNEEYAQLAKLYRNQVSLYEEIKNKPTEEMRLLGRYYRVTFYGSFFGKDDGKTFIYREVKLTHLLDVTGRLLSIYRRLYGDDNIEVLTESGMIDRRLLRADKGYIQITSVKPYFGKDELQDRETVFEENSAVSQFKFEAPFVKGEKKIQGGVDTQWLRRTILRTNGVIPSITKREIVPPCGYIVVEYEPIRVSCKQMKERLQMYYNVIGKQDMPALFPLLQGSLLAQVNEGPLKIAEVFLSSGPRTKYTEKLRDLFRQFLMLNEKGLELVKEFVKTDASYGQLLEMMIEGMDNLRNAMTPYLTAQQVLA